MSALEELRGLLGEPPRRESGPDDWDAVEEYLGSALPGDFKAFLDAYGSGVVSGELVVFHPRGSTPLLERMRGQHQRLGNRHARALADGGLHAGLHRYEAHPAPGGLISWGYDYSGDEHYFRPGDPDPDRWTVVTHVQGAEFVDFDGPFSAFVLAFVRELQAVDHGGIEPEAAEFLEPEDLEELVSAGEIGPVQPSFKPY